MESKLSLSIEKTMTVAQVAGILGVDRSTVTRRIKTLYPGLVRNGITTRLNEEQVTELKKELSGVHNLGSTAQVKNAAKVLNVSGYGRNNLFQFLRDRKILMHDNLPYQTYIDQGYFRVIETKFTTPVGEVKIYFKTLVYQKGLDFIRKELNKEVAL